MNATDIVGYTADASTYCVPCAKELYGDDKLGTAPVYDSEGNEVQPIFASSEWDYQPVCDGCFEPINAAVFNDEIAEYLASSSVIESKVMEAVNSKEIISRGVARNIASQWHDGQTSPLYSFCSTGRIVDSKELLREVEECKHNIAEEPRNYDAYDLWALDKLAEYIKAQA